jgi:hypothetical protein
MIVRSADCGERSVPAGEFSMGTSRHSRRRILELTGAIEPEQAGLARPPPRRQPESMTDSELGYGIFDADNHLAIEPQEPVPRPHRATVP